MSSCHVLVPCLKSHYNLLILLEVYCNRWTDFLFNVSLVAMFLTNGKLKGGGPRTMTKSWNYTTSKGLLVKQ